MGAWRFGCTATVCLVRRLPQSLRIHVGAAERRASAAGGGGAVGWSGEDEPDERWFEGVEDRNKLSGEVESRKMRGEVV